MEKELFENVRAGNSDSTGWQKEFNQMIETYNDDFLFFLRCVASGYYSRLIDSGTALKNLHDLIVFMQSATELRFEVIPLPFTLRYSNEYYRMLGFNDGEIENIHGFFDYVKNSRNKEFEVWLNKIPPLTDLK